MNIERFQNSPAGRMIKVWKSQAPYFAFVPNPLPPDLPLDLELVSLLSEADRALGELAGLGRMMPNPDLLIQPFLRREAVLSSKIEGTQTDIKDLYAFEAQQLSLFGRESAQRQSDAHEQENFVLALKFGLERLKTLPVSLRLIRNIHEQLLKGVRGEQARPGEFRTEQNWIGSPGHTLEDATYVPPPPDEMQQALTDLEKYVHHNNDLPPLIRLAFIHYQFEAIHPFIDGNGRIGRLLISLLAIDWKLLPQPLLYLSAYFEPQRDTYYDLLLAVSERGAWRDWVIFFLRGVAEQSRDALVKAKKLQDLQHTWQQKVTKARSSALLLRVIDHLFDSPIVKISDIERLLKVTWRSAKRIIDHLVTYQVLVLVSTSESGYGKSYMAAEIFQILADS
jgi:Fic family protein